jgi:beta-glucanase (GH16 family)
MGKKTYKNIIPMLFLLIIAFVFFIELKNNIRQIKDEAVENQLNEINGYKSQGEQKNNVVFWEAIERKDSYNNELQFYSKDNAVIEGNIIKIISKKEKRENKMYTSGLVESTYAYKYGYFEFTIVISEGKGIFPAIWFMPMDGDALPEIDLFEMIGSEPYNFYGVIHFEEEGVQDSDYFEQEVSIKDRYSVAIKWTEEAITWYIDGEEIYSTVKGVPQEYMYIIINQAIGGDWPGNPDDDTVFPSLFKILSARIEPISKKGRN